MITLPVEQDDEGCYLTFSDDLREQLGWSVGDVLNWDEQDDGTVIVTKHDSEAKTNNEND
jgi:bifunctional DNA-binding transcriptional regulator/antitoxin component of YhaV-PrlF toxin-antitoxin module